MILINETELIGKNGIQTVNETEYYYELIFEDSNKVLIHKNLIGDKCTIETYGKALLIEPDELSTTESILIAINKLK